MAQSNRKKPTRSISPALKEWREEMRLASERQREVNEEGLAKMLYRFLHYYRPEFRVKSISERTDCVVELIEFLKTQQV